MSVLTKSTMLSPGLETDLLTDHLVKSLDLARSMRMTLVERLLEMSLIEIGQMVAAQERSSRDRGLN